MEGPRSTASRCARSQYGRFNEPVLLELALLWSVAGRSRPVPIRPQRAGGGRVHRLVPARGAPSFCARRFWSVAWRRCLGSRAAVDESAIAAPPSCSTSPGRAAGREDDLDEYLLAPFAYVRFDHGARSGYALVAVLPVGYQVVDRTEVGVDRELVAAGVVARCLVLEVAGRSRPVAGGDPGDVGEIDGDLSEPGSKCSSVAAQSGSPSDPSSAGALWAGVCAESAVGGALRVWDGSPAGRPAHRRRCFLLTRRVVAVAVELADSGSVGRAA